MHFSILKRMVRSALPTGIKEKRLLRPPRKGLPVISEEIKLCQDLHDFMRHLPPGVASFLWHSLEVAFVAFQAFEDEYADVPPQSDHLFTLDYSVLLCSFELLYGEGLLSF